MELSKAKEGAWYLLPKGESPVGQLTANCLLRTKDGQLVKIENQNQTLIELNVNPELVASDLNQVVKGQKVRCTSTVEQGEQIEGKVIGVDQRHGLLYLRTPEGLVKAIDWLKFIIEVLPLVVQIVEMIRSWIGRMRGK